MGPEASPVDERHGSGDVGDSRDVSGPIGDAVDERDGSGPGDAAGPLQLTLELGLRLCDWCRGPLPAGARRDAVTCSQSCRQARHRFGSKMRVQARALEPMRLAYADPPYPGKSGLYRDHPDYGGEVDVDELVAVLVGFDGWALSTSSSPGLQIVLAACGRQGVRPRVAAWSRGARHTISGWPLSAWEPVVYAGGRRVPSRGAGVDVLQKIARPRTTDPSRVIGAKPADFAWWLFDLLGARPGDELVDVYPGSGGIGRAWRMLNEASTAAA